MSVINILSPHVADLIAAGEVVERPASVVKELVENSIDAGAKSIRVEIRGGGMRLIRVSDDGRGMSPEDAGVAFLRHATSKLHDERGLESIETLGFRGEALAAISAVSHIELLTRVRGETAGTRVLLSGGEIEEMGPAGCGEGTVMAVRDLFYNTPARLKFMKSDRAEGAACTAAALRSALGHPEISLRLVRDGEEIFFSPGDGLIKSAVYSLLGRDNAAGLIECSGESGGVSVSGFVSAPHAGRGSRAMQYFFINGRPFKSASVQAALEQAYKNTLLTGRFPGCVLYITLPGGRVDVNVHPAKTEVKFTDEKTVFDCVFGAVRAALERGGSTAELSLSKTTRGALAKDGFFKSMTAAEFRSGIEKPGAIISTAAPVTVESRADNSTHAPKLVENGERASTIARRTVEIPADVLDQRVSLCSPEPEYANSPLVPAPKIPILRRDGTLSDTLTEAAVEKSRTWEHGVEVFDTAASEVEKAEEKIDTDSAAVEPPAREETVFRALPSEHDFRLIGETMDTYILAETAEGLLLIDKHAAHERIIFDTLMRQKGEIMSQTLLMPVTWTPGEETAELIERSMPLLESAGFEIDRFGTGSVIIRAVPQGTDFGGEAAMLEEICEKLGRGASYDERREELLHTVACKAAIKAGMDSDEREIFAIAERVVSGEVKYCPHGRPVSVLLTRRELDRQFKRII